MKRDVVIRISALQRMGSEPEEEVKLLTEGTLEALEDRLILSYAESELTGLEGTRTSFHMEKDRVTLLREGATRSRMVFCVGEEETSLYDMGFGALMIRLRTTRLQNEMTYEGGTLCVSYEISVEEQHAGAITYRIEVK